MKHSTDKKPVYRVVGCLVYFKDRFLTLKRSPNKPKPLTWDLPGGKADPSEPLFEVAAREFYEET